MFRTRCIGQEVQCAWQRKPDRCRRWSYALAHINDCEERDRSGDSENAARELLPPTKNVAAENKCERSTLLPFARAAHFKSLRLGDYFALLAYVERNARHRDALTEIRRVIRDRKHVATCVGFGPRFLHSTGQAYKGGPNSGVFLQLTCDDATDLEVPGQKYSFGLVKAAQARGDLTVLAERGRRVLRVHLGADVAAGLAALKRAVGQALAASG